MHSLHSVFPEDKHLEQGESQVWQVEFEKYFPVGHVKQIVEL